MPYISLGKGAYRRDDGGLPEFRLINLYPEETPADEAEVVLIGRPGMVEHDDLTSGPVVGLFQQDGAVSSGLLAVANDKLYDNGVLIGAVEGDNLARWAATDEEVLVTTGSRLMRYDGTTVAAADTDFTACPSVMYLAGRFLAIMADSGRFYYSGVLDGATWGALDYYTAESSPDLLIDGIVVNDEAWLFGTQSTEVWVATGDGADPYSRIEGRNYSKGILNAGALTLFDNTAAWVGHDGIVYRGDARPIRISNHGIEERIANSTTCYLSAYVDGGHSFLSLRTDQGTFCMDAATSQWCEYQSYNKANFRGQVSTTMDREVYWGDDTSGKIWKFDRTVYTDGSDPVLAIFTGAVALSGPATVDKLDLAASHGTTVLMSGQGYDPVIEMRSSRDGGHVWTDWDPAGLGKQGEYRTLAQWRALGMFDAPGALFEFRVSDPVLRRISGVRANDAGGRRG